MNRIGTALLCAVLVSAVVTRGGAPDVDPVAQEAARLEIELSKYKDASPEAADVLVKLVDFYHAHGRIFALVRAGQKFMTLHASDPRHQAVALQTLDGLEAASRNKEFIAACRQFLARYADSPQAAALEVRLADVLRAGGDRPAAAAAARAVWNRQPDSETGRLYALRAVADYAAPNAASNTEAARLAEEMLDRLPPGPAARGAGWQAVLQWRRLKQWAAANVAGNKLLKQDFADAPRLGYDLHRAMADNYIQLAQQANALEHLRQARAIDDSPELDWQLLDRMQRAEAPAEEIIALAQEYLKKYPARDERYNAQALLGMASLRQGDADAALKALGASLAGDARWNQKASVLVRAAGTEPARIAQAERALKQAIQKNPAQAATLRYVLALQVYVDRLKDQEKARATLRDLVTLSPDESAECAQAVTWLLDNAPGDEEFRAEVERVLEVRRANPHLISLRRAMETWGTGGRKRTDRRERAKYLADELRKFNDDPAVVFWARHTEETRKTVPFEPDVFGQLGDGPAKALFWRFYETTRLSGGGKRQPERAAAAAVACRRFADDYALAAAWVRLAAEPAVAADEALPALRHLLELEPQLGADPALWRCLLTVAADKARDPALGQQAWTWIGKARHKYGQAWDEAAGMGLALVRLKMESEAVAWWRQCLAANSRHDQARPCAEQLLTRLEGQPRARWLTELRQSDSDYRILYALWQADAQFKAGDLAGLEKTLAEVRSARDQQAPATWDSDAARTLVWSWIEKRRGSEMPEADRRRVLTAVAGLEMRVVSPVAQLGLLDLGPQESLPPIERLLSCQQATARMAGSDALAWERLLPFAQAAMSRGDYLAASTLLTGMLTNLSGADSKKKNAAREMIAQSYARLGASGLAIDESSPLAPLLQAALSLRLGDETLAFNTYLEKRALFEKHYLDLPVDLVLFVAEHLSAAGGDENHRRVEDMLRGWMMKFADSAQVDDATKARVQSLLARNYFLAQQYEVARSEFTTVVNRWPDSPQAVDAQFGIGETLMAQRIYDQAQAVFEKLAASRDLSVVIRAEFFRGVLALRRGDHDEARNILKGVLDRVPDVELANHALFRLSEVYGEERRYMEQLLLLRTVGRLGRASQRSHAPGQPLSIVVYDSDLGISRGHDRIPVVVRTEPGGDSETVYLTSGGAGKGLFRADLETRLGAAVPDNHVLELSGRDVIRCDYPAEFKAQFRHAPLSDVEIQVASDAKLDMASTKIEDRRQESFTKTLEKEAANPDEAEHPTSQERPADQIKPGNPVYLRVEDADRDVSDDADQVVVKLTASSGDQAQVRLQETGPHTGVFEGTVATAELPAGALASDSALDHQPLLAIDRDEKTFWQSEPDGATPKWLSVDMRDLKRVARVRIHTPGAAEPHAPLRGELQGSCDGEFFFRLAAAPPPPAVESPADQAEPMTRRVYPGQRAAIESFSDVLDLVRHATPVDEGPAEDLAWARPEEEQDLREVTPYAVVWHGRLIQPREGAARIKVDGAVTALAVDGFQELPVGPGGRSADVWLSAGPHELTVFATTKSKETVGATWARADLRSAQVVLQPFREADFDLNQPAARLDSSVAAEQAQSRVTIEDAVWDCRFTPRELRYVRLMVHEYRGEAVAVYQVDVSGEQPDQLYIPTQADILALASNDVLELSGGDLVTASYLDEQTTGEHSQLLAARLTATYYNGRITPIVYDFERDSRGAVRTQESELLRIEPGERFVIQVADYDEDRTKQRDTVPVSVSVNGAKPLEMAATETEEYSGVFTKEVDTAAEPEEGKLAVKPGDQIACRYIDRQNTFPGHAVPREAAVLVSEPTAARVRIVATQLVPPASGKGDPHVVYLPADPDQALTRVPLGAPLTVEVIDPDAAKNRRSTVNVSVAAGDGPPLELTCELSNQCRPAAGRRPTSRGSAGKSRSVPKAYAAMKSNVVLDGDPSLAEGRFLGQVLLQLGGRDSPGEVPRTPDMSRRLVGGPAAAESSDASAAESEGSTVRVLNVSGSNPLTVTYVDQRRPGGGPETLTAQARLITNGRLACTDRDYQQPVRQLHVGQRMYLQVIDPDQDVSDERDTVEVEIRSPRGEEEKLRIEETAVHSGVFTGSLLLVAVEKPAPGNLQPDNPQIETYFGDTLVVRYLDRSATTESGELELSSELPVVIGTDGQVTAFSKLYGDEELAVETRFRIAESHFELFKAHQALERTEEAQADLEAGRSVLREVMEEHADARYTPRVSYLLGQFAQELGQYDEAIRSYEMILRQFADHALAPDAQYKLAQCHEAAGRFDQALEAYVVLAAEYPQSPLISSVMIRICDHFYKKEQYPVAGQVGEKFLEKFPGHERAAQMAFRVGQCYSKAENFKKAAEAFERFVKLFPEDKLCADALFWAGESYRELRKVPDAFHCYNRCRWDFPASEAAKYARGRLTLPEMVRQFDLETRSIQEKPK